MHSEHALSEISPVGLAMRIILLSTRWSSAVWIPFGVCLGVLLRLWLIGELYGVLLVGSCLGLAVASVAQGVSPAFSVIWFVGFLGQVFLGIVLLMRNRWVGR